MGTRTNTDHVVCDAKDGGAFRCLHCGDRYLPASPQPLSIFCESAKGYALMHKHCQMQSPPSKQVQLFDALAAKERSYSDIAGEAIGITRETFVPSPGIDGMSDEPDPETDPPTRCSLCGMMTPAGMKPLHHIGCGIGAPGPMARHGEGLMLSPGGLHQLITAARPREFWPSLSHVESWHSDVRADVQRWCRVELAHKHPIAGLPLPPRFPMPNVLENVEFAKPKRGGLEMNEAYTLLISERALQEEAARDRQAARTRAAWARGAFATKRPSCSRRNEANLAEARRLRGLGKTMAQIGSALGVTEYTARCWLGYRRPK